jgi:hypothetical protein
MKSNISKNINIFMNFTLVCVGLLEHHIHVILHRFVNIFQY